MNRKLHLAGTGVMQYGCDCLTDANHSMAPLYREPKEFGSQLRAGTESDFDGEFIWQGWVLISEDRWAGENGFIRKFSQLVHPQVIDLPESELFHQLSVLRRSLTLFNRTFPMDCDMFPALAEFLDPQEA